MNTWDKSTLDEMLFNYFEGTLSPDENSRLFQYLKQHPESYTEFESWSQTYALRSAPLDDYEISAKLIKPDRSNRKWYFFVLFSAVVVVALLTITRWKQEGNTNTEVPTPIVKTETNPKVDAPTKALVVEEKKNNIPPNRSRELSTVSRLPQPDFIAEQQQPVQSNVDSMISGETQQVIGSENAEERNDISNAESQEKELEQASPALESKPVVKSAEPKIETQKTNKAAPTGSRKLKVDFKGGKDILKTNENF